MCAQKGEPTLITRSRLEVLSEPTQRRLSRLEHRTQACNGYFFQPLFKLKILQMAIFQVTTVRKPENKFKRQRSSIGRQEDRRRKREKKRKGIAPQSYLNPFQKPKESQGEPKSSYHILIKYQMASWRNQKKII